MHAATETEKTARELSLRLSTMLPGVDLTKSVAFMCGSIVEGFGNRTSDLDVVVVLDGEWRDLPEDRTHSLDGPRNTYHRGDHVILARDLDGQRVDVEVRLAADLEQKCSVILRDAASENFSPLSIGQDWFEFFNDIAIGIPLTDLTAAEEVRGGIPWEALRKSLFAYFEGHFNSHMEDAIGAIQAGDAGPAMYASRGALGSAVDAYITAAGCLNPKPKWRTRKLIRAGLEDDARAYLEGEVDHSAEYSLVVSRAKERLRCAQSFITRAQVMIASDSSEAGR